MPPKILVIDDDPNIFNMWTRLLKREFEMIGAESGPEGIKFLRETQPDAVVLDLMMPVINGWQVCREVRGFSDISGLSDPATKEGILAEGATLFLTKPVSTDQIINAVRSVLK
jgi:DNA-binding response OmpR family regulator